MLNKIKIMIIEDEDAISNFIATTLKANTYAPLVAKTAGEALSMIPSHCPDLILLDLGLPDMDGIEILKKIREWSSTPVIVVSARGEESDKVQALDLGADDYIAKPFGTSELLARIRTALRHSMKNSARVSATDVFKTKGLMIDFDKRLVSVDGKDIHLTQIEFKIVSLLAKSAGRVLTYDYIIKEIWGPNMKNDNRILRVNMANIRKKFGAKPGESKYITNELGVGYRMNYSD